MGDLTVGTRRFRIGTLLGALVLFALAFAVRPLEPRAVPALVAAGVGFAASGAGLPGLVLAVLAAGFAPLETPWRIALGVGAVAIFERSSRREEESARVSDRSFTDRLTGLRTYAFFTEALAHEVGRVRRYGGCCSLVVLDLDRFKEFNDRYGHAAGNALLAEVGAVVRALTRASDIAARFGGEELVVLVPGSARQAAGLAERIREEVALLGVVPGPGRRPIGTTVSAGVAEFPADGRNGDELFAAADAALYAAKDAGRNRVLVAGAPQPQRQAASQRRALAG